MTFLFTGRFDTASFAEFARHRAARLSLAVGPPDLRLASMSAAERRATWLGELVSRFGPAAGEPTGYLETDWSAE